MKKLNNLTLVLAKIFEVAHWVAVVAMVLMVAISIFASGEVAIALQNDMALNASSYEFEIYGFKVALANSTGEVNTATVAMFFIGAAIITALMAMLFRNIYLIMKTLKGKNKHTTSTSPFQKDVIRMIKEIGIFSISVPVVGFFISTVICAISMLTGSGGTEITINIQGFIIGLISLCLTNVFTYGANLEKDVDGLV